MRAVHDYSCCMPHECRGIARSISFCGFATPRRLVARGRAPALLACSELRANLGRANRAAVIERYGYERMVGTTANATATHC